MKIESPIQTLVTHADCPDGIASALLIADAIRGVDVKFMRYQSPELAALPATEGMLFCDFSPPRDRVDEFVRAGAYVLDHHASAKEVVEAFGDRGVFADEKKEPGVCGAVLAFRHVWEPFAPPVADAERITRHAADFALLAGIRDTWQREHSRFREACIQAEMLRFYGFERFRWLVLGSKVSAFENESTWIDRYEVGRISFYKHEDAVKRAIANAYRFAIFRALNIEAMRVVCFQGTHLTSDAAEAIGDGADLVVGFGYEARDRGDVGTDLVLKVSMRSHTDVDCARLARAYGGGGHTRAAGFEVSFVCEDPTAGNPYRHIYQLLNAAWDWSIKQ